MNTILEMYLSAMTHYFTREGAKIVETEKNSNRCRVVVNIPEVIAIDVRLPNVYAYFEVTSNGDEMKAYVSFSGLRWVEGMGPRQPHLSNWAWDFGCTDSRARRRIQSMMNKWKFSAALYNIMALAGSVNEGERITYPGVSRCRVCNGKVGDISYFRAEGYLVNGPHKQCKKCYWCGHLYCSDSCGDTVNSQLWSRRDTCKKCSVIIMGHMLPIKVKRYLGRERGGLLENGDIDESYFTCPECGEFYLERMKFNNPRSFVFNYHLYNTSTKQVVCLSCSTKLSRTKQCINCGYSFSCVKDSDLSLYICPRCQPHMYKRCNKCDLFRPVSKFHKDSSKKDGLRSTCKNCRNKILKGDNNGKKEMDKNKNPKKTIEQIFNEIPF